MSEQSAKTTDSSETHIFTRKQLIQILDACIGKTLGEVDQKRVFDKTISNPKITGIAGMVIEQSVLGYPADSRQEPDLVVDNEHVELKTTGIRHSKKTGQHSFEAKEPMSITAVSPEKIVNEVFPDSHFWRKLAQMLLVYYLYDSDKTVTAAEYANFPIISYQFHEFSEEDKAILENDWSIVRDFIKTLQRNFKDYKSQYPRISSELRGKLLYIDTAPKWPNPPRFRLKRSLVSTIVQEHLDKPLEHLPRLYTTIDAIDAQCRTYTNKYKGRTIDEIATDLGIKQEKYNKAIVERLAVRMFGGTASKMQQIEIFSKSGILGKSVILTPDEKPTEAMKFFTIDFDEIQKYDIDFEDSSFYNYFTSHQFLFIIFKEDSNNSKVGEARFQGFKRYNLDEGFIEREVLPIWKKIRDLIFNKTLEAVIELDKHGNPVINKISGVEKISLNFPKEKEGNVFVRGSASTAAKKTLEINGIHMYAQNIWFAKRLISQILQHTNYI